MDIIYLSQADIWGTKNNSSFTLFPWTPPLTFIMFDKRFLKKHGSHSLEEIRIRECQTAFSIISEDFEFSES